MGSNQLGLPNIGTPQNNFNIPNIQPQQSNFPLLGDQQNNQFGQPNQQIQNVGALTNQMPGFNGLNNLPVTIPPQNTPQAGFDFGGLNLLNNRQTFVGMPFVQQVPVAGFTRLGDGQVVQNIQNTPFIPTTIPGSITNLQQLANLPAGSSTSLGAILQLGGINPGVVSTAGVNTTGALIPPAFGLTI